MLFIDEWCLMSKLHIDKNESDSIIINSNPLTKVHINLTYLDFYKRKRKKKSTRPQFTKTTALKKSYLREPI